MPSIATIRVSYQHCEEILATSGIYEVEGGITTISAGQIIAEELALASKALVGSLKAIMGNRDRLVSIDTFIPVEENSGWGPFGYHAALAEVGTGVARVTKATDMIAAQLVWGGVNELDEKVRNAKFWSCLTPAEIDCLELDEASITEIQTAFETFFPASHTLSSATLNRVVSNTRAGVPGLVTYHPCTEIVCSATLAIIGNRRGDVTPRRGKIVSVPA